MFRNKMHPQTVFIIIFIVAIIFVVGSFAFGFWAKIAYDEWSKLSNTSTGNISGKILDDKKPYIIVLGGNTREVSTDELRKGINVSELASNLINVNGNKTDLPIKISEENNRLLFDVSITNNEKPVFKIVANEFEFNPDGKFDKNSNLNSIEVVDEKLIPRLQIYLQEGNKIFIGGSYEKDNDTVYFTPSAILLNPSAEQFQEHVKILFKYPSYKYSGIMEKANLPDFTEIDKRIVESEKRKAKIIELSNLSNTELHSKALDLASLIDGLQNKYDSKLNPEQSQDYSISKSQQERGAEKEKYDLLVENNHKELLEEYNLQYKIEVLATIEAIKTRLSPENSRQLNVSKIEWSANSSHWFRENISSSLRKAAILLP